jgi:lysophospholipase L1-like esterase
MNKNFITNSLLIIVSTLFAFVIAELAIRVSQNSRFGTDIFSFESRGALVFDKQFGWRATENYRFKGTGQEHNGNEYPITLTTNKQGFRQFGDPNTDKFKLMVIGDSFTHAVDASDDETYYATLSQALPIEVFAMGVGGYGTLQETMVVDKYFDTVQPDAILLQFCDNDFSNNYYELEFNDFANNNGMVRPFLNEHGDIYYDIARENKTLWYIANNYSRLLSAIMFRVDPKLAKPLQEREIEAIRLKSIARTNKILARLKSRVGDVPIYAFNTSSTGRYYNTFKTLSENNGIEFIEGIPQRLEQAGKNNAKIRAKDGAHWSPVGHNTIAQALKDYLAEKVVRP